ncbi:hypothetical protein UFOVP242_135 [uncultured Caudovirales phage]|uniref:Coil containing protein n=1 Tax=uncultured Caudovirales phage TaxID=2100421 RepID=A0A6J7WUZ1_9CAUD|nr:hypothetical protein UFOVP242_135 [uncultured Caudovirales phage]
MFNKPDFINKDIERQIQELTEQRQLLAAKEDLENHKSNLRRARGITVGTAFGGVTEITMRSQGDEFLYAILQPVEVTELIHQLAGNIGCHISIRPRDDFASWRMWKNDETLKLGTRDPFDPHPPHPNDMAPFNNVGAQLPPPEKQPGMSVQQNNTENNETVAVKKTINKRKSKRTADPT